MEMLNLVLKDLLIQKKSVLFAALYIILFVVAFQNMGELMYTTAMIAFTYILVMGGFANDDKNKVDTILNSLPIKRRNIVLCKFLSLFMFLAIGTATYLAVYFIFPVLGIPANVYPITLESFVGGLLAVSILNGIYFPLFFKLGYTRARVINLVIFFSVFFGVPSLVNFIVRTQDIEMFYRIVDFFERQSDIVIALTLLLLSSVLLLVSYVISVQLYKRREF